MKRPRHAIALFGSFGLLMIGLLWAPSARAETLRELFERGNAAYFQGQYGEAIEAYEQLGGLGVEDADVSFNLATAHAREGHYGQAVLHFQRSLRLRPGDEAAEEGLRSCLTTLGRRRAEREGEAEVVTAPPLSEAIFGSFSLPLLAWLAFGLNALFFLGFAGYFVAKVLAKAESFEDVSAGFVAGFGLSILASTFGVAGGVFLGKFLLGVAGDYAKTELLLKLHQHVKSKDTTAI